ncbi:hypothetical protein [uncultured Cardiobacterium sp.]|uniref:hypothetical protein n=1 Tax=uncultured Cardiobacterium sp. TaxID=417619 RepID=UPI002609C596|nr:hypothetical protein [uncultured Cardiobacterium sp.]
MEQLSITLVPTAHETLILPSAIIAHIYPYAPPLLIDNASEFVIGGLLIGTDKLPLLDLFTTAAEQKDEDRNSFRVVLVSSVTTASPFIQYAILAHGQPQIANIGENDITSLGKGSHRYIRRYIALAGYDSDKHLILPDLPALEAELTMS